MSDTTGGEAGDDDVRVLIWLFGCLLWTRLNGVGSGLVFKLKTTFKTSAKQISQIDDRDTADCAESLDLTCMECDKRVSVAQHLQNLSPFSLYSMIEVSAKAWHASLCLGLASTKAWHYINILSRFGSICPGLACYSNILSRLGSICQGLACYSNIFLSRLGSICQGLACYSVSYQALTVSAEAWHAILYLITPWEAWHAILHLITPWQYLLGLGMLF